MTTRSFDQSLERKGDDALLRGPGRSPTATRPAYTNESSINAHAMHHKWRAPVSI